MYSVTLHSGNPENSYEKIAQNAYYEMVVDKAKNRVYFTILGYWKNKTAVEALLSDWKKAVSFTQPNFTVLTDMRTMLTHPQELNELHLAAQQFVIDSGVKQVANVMPTDKIAHLQLNSFTSNSGLPFRNFDTIDEAETWLNQQNKPSLN